jgi:hypothetical protein
MDSTEQKRAESKCVGLIYHINLPTYNAASFLLHSSINQRKTDSEKTAQ